jgi:UDP-3-O-[3-hydroxymyristoyl] glucosamine N-acyltransferase
MRLGEIAKQLGCEVDGDASLEITGVAGIEEARPGELTFLVNRKYRPALEATRASAILILILRERLRCFIRRRDLRWRFIPRR